MLGEATLNGSVTSFREAIRTLILFVAQHNRLSGKSRLSAVERQVILY